MFLSISFKNVKRWKPPKCPKTDEHLFTSKCSMGIRWIVVTNRKGQSVYTWTIMHQSNSPHIKKEGRHKRMHIVLFHLYEIWEQPQKSDPHLSGRRWGAELPPMGHKRNLLWYWIAVKFDWDGSYTGCTFLKSSKSIHKICNLLSFVNYSSIKLSYLKYFYTQLLSNGTTLIFYYIYILWCFSTLDIAKLHNIVSTRQLNI